MTSFVLKESGREFAADALNRFHFYKDVPRMFDAWDIDSNYREQELEGAFDVCTELVADGIEAVIKLQERLEILHIHSIFVWQRTADVSNLIQRLTGKSYIAC